MGVLTWRHNSDIINGLNSAFGTIGDKEGQERTIMYLELNQLGPN